MFLATIGKFFHANFELWLASGKFLPICHFCVIRKQQILTFMYRLCWMIFYHINYLITFLKYFIFRYIQKKHLIERKITVNEKSFYTKIICKVKVIKNSDFSQTDWKPKIQKSRRKDQMNPKHFRQMKFFCDHYFNLLFLRFADLSLCKDTHTFHYFCSACLYIWVKMLLGFILIDFFQPFSTMLKVEFIKMSENRIRYSDFIVLVFKKVLFKLVHSTFKIPEIILKILNLTS